jgi:hypothetical protein
MNLRCRLGLHHLVDYPDPNPESGGLEKQGYRACTRCPKEKDAGAYRPVALSFRLPSSN